MDDRKQRILMAIVSLYSSDGEPVGSQLLSRHFDMAVSSATLRNEMAVLTKLGLLDQPHTSAGRVPTPQGYRYFVDNLLTFPQELAAQDKERIDRIFKRLDYDPEKLAQGAAKALSELLGYTVVTTTPRAEDMRIAHFEVLQVGRYSAALMAVTNAGGVRTRVARVDFELTERDVEKAAALLNSNLRFVAEADISHSMVLDMAEAFAWDNGDAKPILSAALTVLSEVGKPSIYLEGQQYILCWPELTDHLQGLMELFNTPAMLEDCIRPNGEHTTVVFGEELGKPLPDLCVLTRRYLAGGGLTGAIAVLGPTRMNFGDVIPKLEYFSELLGKSMSGTNT